MPTHNSFYDIFILFSLYIRTKLDIILYFFLSSSLDIRIDSICRLYFVTNYNPINIIINHQYIAKATRFDLTIVRFIILEVNAIVATILNIVNIRQFILNPVCIFIYNSIIHFLVIIFNLIESINLSQNIR